MKTEPDVRIIRHDDVEVHFDRGALGIALLVAPATGRLRIATPRAFRRGREWIDPGQPVAFVEAAGISHPVTAPFGGSLGGMLGHDGEHVERGRAVAWVEPA